MLTQKKKTNLITDYSFGKIVVGGKEHTEDLIVFPDRIKTDWWLKKRHLVSLEDLKEVLDFEPEILVIGTGDSGLMKVPLSVQQAIKEKGIKLFCTNTHQARPIFNNLLNQGKKVAGAFHLTC